MPQTSPMSWIWIFSVYSFIIFFLFQKISFFTKKKSGIKSLSNNFLSSKM